MALPSESQILCLSAAPEACWLLTSEHKIFLRTGMTPNRQGNRMHFKLTFLDDLRFFPDPRAMAGPNLTCPSWGRRPD